MHSVAFPYQHRQGHWLPIIPLTLVGPSGPLQVEVYVDSGALMTILDQAVADTLGLSLARARLQRFVVGDGRSILGRVLDTPCQIGPRRFRAPVAFSSQLHVGFNLLGRRGVFEHFDEVAFQDRRRQLVFRFT